MIFTAYLDESGTHGGSDTVAVAGYVSNGTQWLQFEKDWQQALGEFGIERFHMVEFAHSKGAFETWSEEQRRVRLAILAEIIKKRTLGSVATSFSSADYRDTFSLEADRFVGGAYGLAATMTFMALGVAFARIGVFGSIEYVYEAGALGAVQVRRAFDENFADPGQKHRMRLSSLQFRTKQEDVPLQAADILAYEWNLQLARARGNSPRPFRRSLRLLAGDPHDWGSVSKAELAMFGRIIHARTRLRPDQLADPTPAPRSAGVGVAITEEEFKARWKWWNHFKGSRLELGWREK